MRNKCVYQHKTKDNKIFYVGSGNLNRPFEIMGRSKEWFEKINNGYIIEIIADKLTLEESLILENILILEYGRINNNTGILVNKNNGVCLLKKNKPIKKIIKPKYNIIDNDTNIIYSSFEEIALIKNKSVNLIIRNLEGKTFSNLNIQYIK